jgi:hypothetical protein
MNTTAGDLLTMLSDVAGRWDKKPTEDGALPIQEFVAKLLPRLEDGYLGDFFRTEFVVEGEDEFPYDMLRYTHSFPADEQASFLMRSHNETMSSAIRRVKLATYHRDPVPHLATDRWISKFRWRVVKIHDTVAL